MAVKSRIVWSRICRIIWDFQDGGGPANAGALVQALDESLRAFTRDHERLRVLGGLSGAGFAGFIGIFRMVGVPPALVRLYERWTRVCERLREIMSVCECLRVLGGLSEAGFAGFFGILRMVGPAGTGTLVRVFDERLRAFASVGWIVWSRICRIIWDFQDGGGPAGTGALVRALHERLRAFTRDSDKSSEGTGRAAGDFRVGLPVKAGQRGYFSEFFHKNVRFVRSKAYFAFDFGLFQVSCQYCRSVCAARSGRAADIGRPKKGTKFHEENSAAGRRQVE